MTSAADRARAMTDEQVAAFQADAIDILTATTSSAFIAALRAATIEEIRRLVLEPVAERVDSDTNATAKAKAPTVLLSERSEVRRHRR